MYLLIRENNARNMPPTPSNGRPRIENRFVGVSGVQVTPKLISKQDLNY